MIGVGKTFFVEAAKKSAPEKMMVVQEPHESNPYLADFYMDPSRYGFACQLQFLSSRASELKRTLAEFDNDKADLISDRSIAEDRVFAQVLHEEDVLTDRDLELYDQFYKHIEETLPEHHTPDVYVFLDVTVETCLGRIQKRGREFETSIDRSYLERLQHFYEEFLERVAETALVVRVSWEEFKDPVDTIIEVMRLYQTKKTGMVMLPSHV